MAVVRNDLFDYKNRYIYQLEKGFKFSLDSILIAEYVRFNKNSQNILDLCTGNAPIPLILSLKTKSIIHGFEIQKKIYKLAKKSIEENKLEKQIKIINDDVKNLINYFPKNHFDIITCNPPFFNNIQEKNVNKNDYLSIARHEIKINLEDILSLVSQFLKENGTFYLIHRLTRLDEILIIAAKYKLFIKEIQIILTKENQRPEIVLFKIKKNAKKGIKFNKIINIEKEKTYQNLFKENC